MSGPQFIDNRDGNTFQKSITEHLEALRKAGKSPKELCIATGYFNASGWLKISEEAEKLEKVRLLIGAEPNPNEDMNLRQPGDPREPERTERQVQTILDSQVQGLKKERDQSFDFHPDGFGRLKNLLEFFRSDRVEVRRYDKRFFHAKAWLLRGESHGILAGSSNLTAAGMSRNLELNIGEYENLELLKQTEDWYDEIWQEAVPFDLAELYEVLFQEFSPWLIYLRVLWELYGEEIGKEEEEEDSNLSLARFQNHGVWRAQNIIQELGGVIVADGVGLGKTFIAGKLMEGYKQRRQRILLLRPAALKGDWDNFLSNNYLGDVEAISYQGLANDRQFGGETPHLNRPTDEYQLVVIDEAHNYRNPNAPTRAGILRKLLRGQKRDLVLLTATPVNNTLLDLYHLISFFLQDSRLIHKNIHSIKGLFDDANHIDPGDLHPDLLYPLVDATTVKRTRQFIKKHYSDDRIPGRDGVYRPITFPKPVPLTVRYDLEDVLPGFFSDFARTLMPENGEPDLTLARYQIDQYLLKPNEDSQDKGPLIGLLRSGLLKRFESSAHAFANTCRKMVAQHRLFLKALDKGQVITAKDLYNEAGGIGELEEKEFQALLEASDQVEDLRLYDQAKLRKDVEDDLALLTDFTERAELVQPEDDPKLRALVEELAKIAEQAVEDSGTDEDERDNRKVLIFSYYKDTALWILRWLSKVVKEDERLQCFQNRIVATSGSGADSEFLRPDEAAWGFVPKTAAPDTYDQGDRFDVLIATDVLAEGVNLQQCRHIINFDLPWNPMRLVQRHGRIDRLQSTNKRVFMRTFFPASELDDLLNLEGRVRDKLALAAASVGVADTPIMGGAQREQSFSQTRSEIEAIENEEADIYENGGTSSGAQTGEEYRQELRKALSDHRKDDILDLPWKAGSGMVKGDQTGHFFCAKIGDQTFLRFVPKAADRPDEVMQQLGTCLRLITCTEETATVLPDSAIEPAYHAWQLARESIWNSWDHYTDPANLQPKVAKLNHEVDEFLRNHPPDGQDTVKLDRVSETLMSPWPKREENKLRETWKDQNLQEKDKALALIEAVLETGIEPFEQPERFPKIDLDEVRLVCWLFIQSESGNGE